MKRRVLSRARRRAWLAGGVAAILTLTGVASLAGGGISAASAPVHLTFWSWVPGISASVGLWNKTHPGIQVTVDETTSGEAGTYAKMFSALQAGNAPDLGQVEYDELPNFEHVGGLENISPFGAAKVQKQFVGWTWSQVSLDGSVYAIPQDTGPMALFYRSDLFKKYGLAVPTTWQQYLADAEKLHSENPNAYITSYSPQDPASSPASRSKRAPTGSRPRPPRGS